MKNIVWVDVFNNLECGKMWTVFKRYIYNEVISEFVPKQTRRKTKRQSRKLHKLREKRLKWRRRYKISGVQTYYVKYKFVMDHARTEVRKTKGRHESKIASNIKTDPKMFYKYARSKMNVKEGIGSLKDENGRDTPDVGKMTCILNQYFATVFTEEDLSDMPVPMNMCNSDEVVDEIATSQSAVYQKLRNLELGPR